MSQAHKEQKNMSGKVAGLHPLMVRVAGLQMIWSLKDQRDSKRSSELSSVFHLDFSHLSLHIPSPPPWFLWLPWLPMVSHRSHDCTTALPSFGETVTLRIAASPHRHQMLVASLQHVLPSLGHRHVAVSPSAQPSLCTSVKTTAIYGIVHGGWLRLGSINTTLFWSWVPQLIMVELF